MRTAPNQEECARKIAEAKEVFEWLISAVDDVVRHYLHVLGELEIHATGAVLFGSFARGDANEWSDIDLIVIAPEFDQTYTMGLVEELWRARLFSDIRIEPIPCGELEWETDGGRPILEIARQEGVVIAA